MDHAASSEPIVTRLREGFERIAFVLRADLWAAAGDAGLNPAQAQVLGLLGSRPAGVRPKEIAAHLAVSPASIADTLNALVRKQLVVREADPGDARAVIVRATRTGFEQGEQIAKAGSQVADALAALSPSARQELLLTQIKLIRQLQNAGAIPHQRMCPSCRYFRPHAHPGATKPHHCAFVDAAIGGADLRLDCAEHEAADPLDQADTWAAFIQGQVSPEAHP